MSQAYGMLPSKMLAEATTVDLIIFDSALSWKNYINKKQNGSVPNDSVKQEDLQRRMNQVKK